MRAKYKTGDEVGIYTVIEYAKDKQKYICKCNLCGNISAVCSSNILRSKHCTKCKISSLTKPREDLSGKRFGRLTVQYSIVRRNGHSGWMCLCDCGNTAVVQTSKLKSGHTKSCGCYMRDRASKSNSIILTGQRFGRLVAIRRTEGHKTPSGQILSEYECICDCGNVLNVLAMNLVSGNTQSCGCIGNSVGEAKVNEKLQGLNVMFKRQYTLKGLSSKNGVLLRFDFALLDSEGNLVCLVEYNGEQHYYTPERKSDFGRQQREETDGLKREYCNKHLIQLFEIRYDEDIDEKIEEIYKYYLAHYQ